MNLRFKKKKHIFLSMIALWLLCIATSFVGAFIRLKKTPFDLLDPFKDKNIYQLIISIFEMAFLQTIMNLFTLPLSFGEKVGLIEGNIKTNADTVALIDENIIVFVFWAIILGLLVHVFMKQSVSSFAIMTVIMVLASTDTVVIAWLWLVSV